MKKTGLIFLIIGIFTMAGCASQSTNAPGSILGDGTNMTRLEKNVQDSCETLVRDITPGRIAVSWTDNLHPNCPMLSEAYIASMYERSLVKRGFTLEEDDEIAKYTLRLTMTPSRKNTLIMASLSSRDVVLTTAQSYISNGSESWNRSLGAYRFRTKTRIALGSEP